MSKFKPKWTEEEREIIVAEVCGRLVEGIPMTVICSDHDMPSVTEVMAWAAESPLVGEAIARARSAGFDAIAARVRRTVRGLGEAEGGDSKNDVARDKLIADTDLKLLAKWDPKRYGDAFQLKHADADGEKLDTAPLLAELMGILRPAKAAQKGADG